VLDLSSGPADDSLLKEAKLLGVKRVLSRGAFPRNVDLSDFTRIEVLDKGSPVRTDENLERAQWVNVRGPDDVKTTIEAAKNGGLFVVQCEDWKVIPLENLIAEFHRTDAKLYASVTEPSEVELNFSILEKGVDGVVIPISILDRAKNVLSNLMQKPVFHLAIVKITRVVDVGLGDRVCVDTASSLALGEGLLVGSTSRCFFLIHGETIPSAYIPTRPFRINAGAIHSYVITTDGRTKYLSELKSGDVVPVVSAEGVSREVVVGRIKIERRPLVMITGRTGDVEGSVFLQKAETVRLVRADGGAVSVTDLQEGQEVLAHVGAAFGRHFGGEVEEFVVEK